MRKLNRAKRAKSLAPDMFYVPRGELVLQLKDSLGNLLEERREKINISAVTAWQELTADFVAKEEGEVTVFIDNSDTEPVYFDNLELRVASDPTLVITQEHHYYPFGMNLSGIERQGDLMYQFNGMVEKEQAFGLELYETPFRSYDAQLGRFWQVEPLADEFHSISMFQFGFNNPISANDPTGLRVIYTLQGPEEVRGLSDYIYDRNSKEFSYNEHTGQYKDGNGNVREWGQVDNFLQENYAVNLNRLANSILNRALGVMGKGVITNLDISAGNSDGELVDISYNHVGVDGKETNVNVSVTSEGGGSGTGWDYFAGADGSFDMIPNYGENAGDKLFFTDENGSTSQVGQYSYSQIENTLLSGALMASVNPQRLEGGAWKNLTVNSGEQRHHSPSSLALRLSNSGISHRDGACVIMTFLDHKQTHSWGIRGIPYSTAQAGLMRLGKNGHRAAMGFDIRNINQIGAGRYTLGLFQMWRYTEDVLLK